MHMHIHKTGNNKTIIKITNTYALAGNDTGLHAGDNAVQDLNVGGNKDPLAEDFTALYNDAVHRNTPLSVKKPAAAGLKFFYYFTPRQNFCQRPGRKIAPFTQYRRPFLLFPGSLYKAHIRCCGPCTVRVSVGVGFHPRPGVGFRNSPFCFV